MILFPPAGDGKAVVVAIERVFRIGAEEMMHEVVEGEETDDFAVAVGDEEEKSVGAEEDVEDALERIIIADEIETGVENIGDAGRFFDVEVVEVGGVDTADEFAFHVFDWEMIEAGAIETVEGEWAEDFVGADVDDFGGGEHDAGGFDVGEIKEVGHHFAFALGENAVWSLGKGFENVSAGARGVVNRTHWDAGVACRRVIEILGFGKVGRFEMVGGGGFRGRSACGRGAHSDRARGCGVSYGRTCFWMRAVGLELRIDPLCETAKEFLPRTASETGKFFPVAFQKGAEGFEGPRQRLEEFLASGEEGIEERFIWRRTPRSLRGFWQLIIRFHGIIIA